MNPRPSGYEPDELPGCSTPQSKVCCTLVGEGGYVKHAFQGGREGPERGARAESGERKGGNRGVGGGRRVILAFVGQHGSGLAAFFVHVSLNDNFAGHGVRGGVWLAQFFDNGREGMRRAESQKEHRREARATMEKRDERNVPFHETNPFY